MTDKPQPGHFVLPDDLRKSSDRKPLKQKTNLAAQSIGISTLSLSKAGFFDPQPSNKFQIIDRQQDASSASASNDLSQFVFPTEVPSKKRKVREQSSEPTKVETARPLEQELFDDEQPSDLPEQYTSQIAEAPNRNFDWLTQKLLNLLISEAIPEQKLYLLVTPNWLSRALSDEFCCYDAEQAEQLTKELVSSRYKILCIEPKQGLDQFLAFDNNGLPVCLPLLASSVLACYHMQGDAQRGPLAYYDRFADFLEIGINSQSLPERFEGQKFEHLWFHFGDWLLEHHGIELALPEVSKTGARRYIAYPLKHVALRQVDVSKLPLFFDWADFQAGQQPSELQLGLKMDRWSQVSQKMSSNGKDSLKDERREAVLLQVASELKHWDGSVPESSSSTSSVTKSRIEIFLDWEGVRPRLYWCPRRPPTYPLIWTDGTNVFDSNDGDCWYETTPLGLDDGDILLKGFHWEMKVNAKSYRLSRPSSACISFGPSPQMNGNKLSRNSLPYGLECSVLVHDSILPAVLEYLGKIAGTVVKARSYSTLPEGWQLIKSVVPLHEAEPPLELDCLRVDGDTEITLSGGLRLGREYKWLKGSPPDIYVSGNCVHEVTFDSQQAELKQGRLDIPSEQFTLGVHTVQAAKRRISFEVLDARLDQDNQPTPAESVIRPLCLPSCYRTVIGAKPGEIKQATFPSKNGNIFLTPFQPVWAFSSTPKKALCIRSISVPRLQRQKFASSMDKASLDWARIIYDHHCQKGKLACHEALEPTVVRTLWQGFYEAAKTIKKNAKVHK